MKGSINVIIPDNTFSDIDTFLFDLDGTLIDTLVLHIEAFQWISKSSLGALY